MSGVPSPRSPPSQVTRPQPHRRVLIAPKSSLRLRQLRAADLPFADSLRAHAGWNQTVADWKRFLAMAPEGCFLAEWEGAPAATAATVIYGPSLAWVGMVLVHPDYRRRGIARALLERSIDHLHDRGVRCIKLDATPVGKQVYDSLGFEAEWTLTRWAKAGVRPRKAPERSGVRRWREADARRIDRLDSLAFGVSRRQLVRTLARQSRLALVLESPASALLALGLVREGAQSNYLGPVIAASPDAARPIIEGLLAHGRGENLLWDIPDPNGPAASWARRHGFVAQRSLTRMYLGENTTPGDPLKQFALGGPEIG